MLRQCDSQDAAINHIAASGMRFTDYHSNRALCLPTLAALMTGRLRQRCVEVADDELSLVFREQCKGNPVQRWACEASGDCGFCSPPLSSAVRSPSYALMNANGFNGIHQ